MLVVCVFASALGGLIMCLLVLRDEFSTAAAQAPRTDHDLQITRVGHVIAAICFAMTALLAIILVARAPLRAGQPRVGAPDARITERVTALDRDRAALVERLSALGATVQTLREQLGTVNGGVQGMRTRLDQTESRVAKAESGVTGAEAALKRLGEEIAQANARARQAERSAATKPIVVGPRETVVPAAPLPPPTPQRRSQSARPHESVPVSIPPTVAGTPAPPTQPAPTPPVSAAPTQVATSAPAARQTPTTKPAPSAAASAPSDATSGPQDTPAGNLTDKVRNDWNVIRRGFSTAADDLSAAMRDFGRRATGRE
jgi:hypothetical protein